MKLLGVRGLTSTITLRPWSKSVLQRRPSYEGKPAAIWWRVSTDDQREISPDTQIGEALALAEQEGYNVSPENVIGTDWKSLLV